MKIHGYADIVVIGSNTASFTMGENNVTKIFVGLEGGIAYVVVTMQYGSTIVAQKFSYVGTEMVIKWSASPDNPDVQSATEWGRWAAEAAGYMAFKGAYQPHEELPKHLEHFHRVLPAKRSPDAPTMAMTPKLSGFRAPHSVIVDSDAGGPMGLDVESDVVNSELAALRIRPVREKPKPNHECRRLITVDSGDFPADVVRTFEFVTTGAAMFKLFDVMPGPEVNEITLEVEPV